ncbi:YbeD family protein [Fastidiosibacter lacustris]|uniref:HP0495 family protein n=1 Tax=Fastidiosibacter lacustris TaxID=2056695 RepID=UPI000E34F3F2|nr:DUF493 domain-containing protein [Fastidiosibacter lacustris]
MTENNKDNTPKIQENIPQQETFFEFPCQFPIKIMANPQKEVVEFVLNTLEKYVDEPDKIEFSTRESKTGKYISITAIFEATSKEQLDNIYQTLSAHKEIHMVL